LTISKPLTLWLLESIQHILRNTETWGIIAVLPDQGDIRAARVIQRLSTRQARSHDLRRFNHYTRRPFLPLEMRVLFALLLHAFHFIYTIVIRVRCLCQSSSTPPQAILSLRRRIPNHLAIVFVINEATSLETVQDVLCTSVLNAVEWCQSVGIKKLTVYEERGVASRENPTVLEFTSSLQASSLGAHKEFAKVFLSIDKNTIVANPKHTTL